jgi:hypothetical protein
MVNLLRGKSAALISCIYFNKSKHKSSVVIETEKDIGCIARLSSRLNGISLLEFLAVSSLDEIVE